MEHSGECSSRETLKNESTNTYAMASWPVMIAFLVAITILGVHTWYLQPWTVDDAFITYRYAGNMAEGHGPVYNPGERVEGYTTFLWMAILAAGRRLGLDIVWTAKSLGILFAAGCFLLLAVSDRFVNNPDKRLSWISVLLLGASAMFTANAMSGMETAMTAFWILLSVLLHQKGRDEGHFGVFSFWTSVTCVLAAISRPDAGLVFLVLFADRLVLSIKRRDGSFFWFGLAFSVMFLPYFAWRYWYYGWLLPNTFYAKVGHSQDQIQRGGRYVAWYAIAVFPVLSFMLVHLFRGASRGLNSACAIILGYLMYIMYVGGDALPAYRLLTPISPLLCLYAADALSILIKHRVRLCATVLALAVYGISMGHFDTSINQKIQNGRVWKNGMEVGLWMRENAPENALLATNTAGTIPYYSRLPVIDMLGLNDEVIAHTEMPRMGKGSPGHEKGNGKYVLSRHPHWIQFGSASGSARPVFVGDREIANDPEFKKKYVLKTYRLPSGLTLRLYERKKTS